MHSHTSAFYDFIDSHLPKFYVEETIAVLEAKGNKTSINVIRNVRGKKTKTNKSVLHALVVVAKRHKKINEELELETLK